MRLLLTCASLLSLASWSILRLKVSLRETLAQFHEAGVRSIPFVAVTMGFIGMIGVYQIASTMARILPEFSTLGAATLQGLTSEMGPVMAGLLLATRVGTGMAAEIGSMKVTDQLEAMKLSSVDPVEMLVVPRLLSSAMAGLTLAVMGTAVAYFAGLAVAWFGFSILPDTFMSLRFVRMHDLWVGVSKAVTFGVTVPLVSCACGFDARGGSEGVGTATTRAVVYSSFAVILLDAFISWVAEVLVR